MSSNSFDEHDIIQWVKERTPRRPDTILGIGDDAALLAAPSGGILVCSDTIVEGVHFDASTPKELVGRKALAVNLSDIAAMGASPTSAIFNPTLPRTLPREQCLAVCQGVLDLAGEFGIEIVGGDTVIGDTALAVNVVVFGKMAGQPITRAGAQVGDLLCVTGSLGGSLASGRHLTFAPRLDESAWLTQHCRPTAMLDLSDGLGADLRTLAKASGVGFVVDGAAVPLSEAATLAADPLRAAFSDGEDFELLFTIRAQNQKNLEQWPFATPCTVIGRATNDGRLVWQDDPRREIPYTGYVHRGS